MSERNDALPVTWRLKGSAFVGELRKASGCIREMRAVILGYDDIWVQCTLV